MRRRQIIIAAPIKPVPFKRVQTRGKQRYEDARYRMFKDELGWCARRVMGDKPFLRGALHMKVEVYKSGEHVLTSQWGDVDNFAKSAMDALNGICYLDDAQIKKLEAEKFTGTPHIVIMIREMLADDKR